MLLEAPANFGLGAVQRLFLTTTAHLDLAVKLEALRTQYPQMAQNLGGSIDTLATKLGDTDPLVIACRQRLAPFLSLVEWARLTLKDIRGRRQTGVYAESAPDPAVSSEAWHLAYYTYAADESKINQALGMFEDLRLPLERAVYDATAELAARENRRAPQRAPERVINWGSGSSFTGEVLNSLKTTWTAGLLGMVAIAAAGVVFLSLTERRRAAA